MIEYNGGTYDVPNENFLEGGIGDEPVTILTEKEVVANITKCFNNVYDSLDDDLQKEIYEKSFKERIKTFNYPILICTKSLDYMKVSKTRELNELRENHENQEVIVSEYTFYANRIEEYKSTLGVVKVKEGLVNMPKDVLDEAIRKINKIRYDGWLEEATKLELVENATSIDDIPNIKWEDIVPTGPVSLLVENDELLKPNSKCNLSLEDGIYTIQGKDDSGFSYAYLRLSNDGTSADLTRNLRVDEKIKIECEVFSETVGDKLTVTGAKPRTILKLKDDNIGTWIKLKTEVTVTSDSKNNFLAFRTQGTMKVKKSSINIIGEK